MVNRTRDGVPVPFDVDEDDLEAFEACATGPGMPANVCCDGGDGCP
jgi:hypothetical protein